MRQEVQLQVARNIQRQDKAMHRLQAAAWGYGFFVGWFRVLGFVQCM